MIKKKTVNYKDAWLNIYDVPVIYFQNFHPDPTVKRQSGFLTPAFVTSNNLGNYFKVPYFFAISENRDFTFLQEFTIITKQFIKENTDI